MRRRCGRILLAGLLSLATLGCGGGAMLDSTGLAGAGGWVIVVFMSADNELEAQAIADVNEMEAAGLIGTGVTVVALIDRAVGYDDSNGDWSGTRLYEITDDPDGVDGVIASVELAVPALGIGPETAAVELNTGDPRTLAAVLDFVDERYRPERTALIVWGHGGGYASTGYDESAGGDVLHTGELAAALAGRELDVIGFDTDYAAAIEVAWELRESARFMVASQDAQPADGWEYDDLLRRFVDSDRTPRSLANSIGESYASIYSEIASATLSTIRLDRVTALMDALNNFSDALSGAIDSSEVRDEIRATLFYDVEDFYSTPGDLAIDLGDLGLVVARDYDVADAAAAALTAAVSEAVVTSSSGSANQRATGISVHLVPLRGDGTAETSHAPAYFRGAAVEHPLSFVDTSTWVPRLPDGPGLLHRLFYVTSLE